MNIKDMTDRMNMEKLDYIELDETTCLVADLDGIYYVNSENDKRGDRICDSWMQEQHKEQDMNMYLVDYIIGTRYKVVVVLAENQKQAMAKAAESEPEEGTIRIQACQYANDAVVLVKDNYVKA